MNITIARIGRHPTVAFAAKELADYLTRIDREVFIDERIYGGYDPSVKNALWVGIDGSISTTADYDEIVIDVKNGVGRITASNERSVLIAVYRLLFELGCRFLFPGKDGEVIPKRKLNGGALTLSLTDRASYRHRGMCIEGSVCYSHVYDMIDWLPKVGMNGYFMQFRTPAEFFKRFHNRNANKLMTPTPVNDDDVARMWARLEEEIAKRALDYHAVGHGWTCEPFGISGTGWDVYNGEIDESIKPYLAEINGERTFFGGKALNTNLCYSRADVRAKVTDAIVEYSRDHKTVNFLHFWLADGQNNHCECPDCADTLPSDFYVMMLNELDEKLTAAGLDTRIVCLIYKDLLWEPKREKIKNPRRFVLMFAPITRTYSHAFADFDRTKKPELSPYVRNKLIMPSSVEENIARLQKWQAEQLDGDSFDFDYHLMWDSYIDPGAMECARILHTDMANLYRIGLGGMVSCQTQRAAFPTGLPMYSMARALWDKESSFNSVCDEYFSAAFGNDGEKVMNYLSTLSTLFDPVYLRGEKPKDPEGVKAHCAEAKQVINTFKQSFAPSYDSVNPSIRLLAYHADVCLSYADMLTAYLGGGNEEERADAKERLYDVIHSIEPYVHAAFDLDNFKDCLFKRYLKRHGF